MVIFMYLFAYFVVENPPGLGHVLNLTFKQYRAKFSDKIRPQSASWRTSPEKQVNSGRLRPTNSSKLVFLRFSNTSPSRWVFVFSRQQLISGFSLRFLKAI